MNALTLPAYGPTSNFVFAHVTKPTLTAPTQILIKVKAVAVSSGEGRIRQGDMTFVIRAKLPLIMGMEYAGIVEHVGGKAEYADGSKIVVGDNIVGSTMAMGCYAEFAVIESKELIFKKPDFVSFEHAAGFTLSGYTAYRALVEEGGLTQNDGKRVLIIGGSGGFGSCAVQMAKIMGASVTAICSAANMDYVKSLGAGKVFDYTAAGFAEALEAEEKIDIVVDAVGGDYYWDLTRPLIKKGGIFVTAVGSLPKSGKMSLLPALSAFGTMSWRTHFGAVRYKFFATATKKSFVGSQEMLSAGLFNIFQTKTFQLRDGAKAHDILDSGRTVGKLVLVP